MSQPWEMVRRYVVQVPQPAAGANVTITPNRVGDWLVHQVVLTLTTSAVVANRAVALKATDGTSTYFLTASASVQAASLSQQYSAFEGSGSAVGVAPTLLVPWPSRGLYLPQGFSLQSAIANIDVADQLSAVTLWVSEYPTGPDTSWSPVSAPQIVERGIQSGY